MSSFHASPLRHFYGRVARQMIFSRSRQATSLCLISCIAHTVRANTKWYILGEFLTEMTVDI